MVNLEGLTIPLIDAKWPRSAFNHCTVQTVQSEPVMNKDALDFQTLAGQNLPACFCWLPLLDTDSVSSRTQLQQTAEAFCLPLYAKQAQMNEWLKEASTYSRPPDGYPILLYRSGTALLTLKLLSLQQEKTQMRLARVLSDKSIWASHFHITWGVVKARWKGD